ncbi:peptide ligase PGM1-related protein [Streptomyces sp. NPDC012746]|uniref:preATP grasp domain-containing protein n=1 Tax=Streptomyces sp. NPDC012746 TaxID=3364845 RepID=UPI0036AE4D53
MNEPGPLVVFANFLSDLAVDLDQGQVLAQWAEQAPRKAWLLRPGDVLVTPVPLSGEFLRYVGDLTGVPGEQLTVVEVPPAGPVPLAEAVRRAGLVERVRDLVAGPGTAALLPTALDASAIAFARDLGLTVHPYPTIDGAAGALRTTMLLNTKAGFRDAAEQVGMRLPTGRVCRRPAVEGAVRELLQRYERVVVKPDRSAGGHGLRFLARGDLDGGAMRTVGGSFTGYTCPLPPSCAHVAGELEEWGRRLGRRLSGQGYLGPFGVDALVGTDGVAYASESNVRRTATTTPHAMITRLTAASAVPHPAWSVAKGRARRPFGFEEALRRLRGHDLAFDPGRGEGVVLYADAPPDGRTWRYAVVAADAGAVREREGLVAEALELERGA